MTFNILYIQIKKVMKSGIYKIKNIKNENFYIGSSKNIERRWYKHKSQLKYNRHENIILQRAYNKYGKDSFIFEIIEECDVLLLLEREQYYLDTLKPKYNIGLKSSGGDNLTNHPNRLQIIEKMTESVKERYSNMSDEEKYIHSENCKGEKNPNFGNTWTDEMKEIARNRSTEYYKTHEHYKTGKKHQEIYGEEKAKEISEKLSKVASERIGEKNGFFGKQHTEEYKQKASERSKGKYYGEQNIPFTIDGIEYKSLGEAAKILGIPFVTIRWRLKSLNEKFKNYQYKNEN